MYSLAMPASRNNLVRVSFEMSNSSATSLIVILAFRNAIPRCRKSAPYLGTSAMYLRACHSLIDNRSLICFEVMPVERSWRTAATCSFVSGIAPDPCRPFFIMSATLSLLLPRNKWLGFTQAGLSPSGQLCRTCAPSGIGPLCNSQEYLCVLRRVFDWIDHMRP